MALRLSVVGLALFAPIADDKAALAKQALDWLLPMVESIKSRSAS